MHRIPFAMKTISGLPPGHDPISQASTPQAAAWVRLSRHWALNTSPMRPSAEDGAFTLSALQAAFPSEEAHYSVVVLGVTPEVVGLDWPRQVRVLAFDQSPEMIHSVWRSNPTRDSSVTQARWEALPLDDASTHAIAGDGSLNALPGLESYPNVLSEMHRILAPGGRVALRCFVRPDVAESPETIGMDVFSGKVGGISALKWRLAMTLVEEGSASVRLPAVYRAFETLFPSREALMVATGWTSEEICTIDPYLDSPTCLNFPTLAQFKAACGPWFDVIGTLQGTYELAERCPTLVMRRRERL